MIISRVRGERCERCHAKKGRNGLRNCSNGCENVLYCSIECQESDYITHVASGECGLIQKRLPSNDNVRFILRFLLALRVIPGKDLPCIIDRLPGYSEPRSFRWLQSTGCPIWKGHYFEAVYRAEFSTHFLGSYRKLKAKDAQIDI